MNEVLLKLIQTFKEDKRLLELDEAATKQAVVLKILSVLGWDPFNIYEVSPEYSVGGRKVDYALIHNGKVKVFIEVKKVNEDLERHQEQLLNYSFQEGIPLAVLTNGISWWFYLPLLEGSWEQRKFYTIEIYEQKEEEIVKKFEEFLSKDNVISNKALENAKRLHSSRQKQSLIKETLPKAWNKIITEPDEFLVELLADTTEKLCGYKPESKSVEQFLNGIEPLPDKLGSNNCSLKHSIHNYNTNNSKVDYTGKSVKAFSFRGKRYNVSSWQDMWFKIIELMLADHRKTFEEKVLTLKGRKRAYFAKNNKELHTPKKLETTALFVETNLSSNRIATLSKQLIELFGYNKDDLQIYI